MSYQPELHENTYLTTREFPFNIFHNNPEHHNILGLHWHENYEIIYIGDGHAVFNIGNKELEARSGDILFVSCGLLHSGYSIDNTRVDYYAIVFHPSLLTGYYPDSSLQEYIAPFLDGEFDLPIKILHNPGESNQEQRILQEIIKEFNEKKPGYELAVKSHLYLLILSILRCYAHEIKKNHYQQRSEKEIKRFEALMSYVENHYMERISIGTAAEIIHLSPHHFCKTFKRITGRTFLEYLNLYRVNKAEELLRETTLPITLIAEKVGFSNINYFGRVFKQYKRYPPSQCRK